MLGLWWTCAAMLLLTACRTAPATLPPTSTTLRVIQATQVPTALRAVASLAPGGNQPDECEPDAAQATTQHTVSADISYGQRRAVVHQQIRTVNRMGERLQRIVLDAEANRFPGTFTLDGVTTDLGVPAYELTGRRLTIDLEKPFEPDCTLTIDLDFTLHIQPIGGENGWLGYSQHQLNLGGWLPVMALRRDGEWITHDVSAIGEQTIAETADWDVTLTVSDAPDSLMVAAPGAEVEHDAEGKRWRFRLPNGRDFTVSLSPLYERLVQTSGDGTQIELYTFGERTAQTAGGTVDNTHQALTAAAQAVALYSDLFGAYPHERFVIVQGDFPDGMEFSGLVFVGEAWFRTNTGTAQSYLTIITVHETSHQWWYASVGNDPALDPWLDEALAVYSEYIFYEERYPDLREWWWNFRVRTFVPSDYAGRRVDSSVYEFESGRDYINAVYLRGALMLDALREDLGTDEFFNWLRRYADVGQNRVVTADDLWTLLTPEQLEGTKATRAEFLSEAES